LADKDGAVRYWAAMGLGAAGEGARTARAGLGKALRDESVPVRIEAAAALVRLGEDGEAVGVLVKELEGEQLDGVLLAARTLQLLGEAVRPARPAMRRVLARAVEKEKEAPQWLFIRFSLEAALGRVTWRP